MGKFFAILFAIAYLCACIFCVTKESEIAGVYCRFGVYKRIVPTILLFIVSLEFNSATEALPRIIICIVSAAIFAFYYYRCKKKCPEFLQKDLAKALLISAFGATLKIIVFFIPGVWKKTGTVEMLEADGTVVLIYKNGVYNKKGVRLGVMQSDGKSYKRTLLSNQ